MPISVIDGGRSQPSTIVLQAGATGQQVIDMQNALRFWGFYTGPSDGTFGTQTQSALSSFQKMLTRDFGLTTYTPGAWDNQTATAYMKFATSMNSIAASRQTPAAAPTAMAAPPMASAGIPPSQVRPPTQTAPTQIGTGASAPAPSRINTGAQDSAKAIISNQLSQYGLGSLANWAYQFITAEGTVDSPRFMAELRRTNEYAMRFQGNKQRVAKGMAELDPATYLSVEDAYRQTMRQYGLPPGFYDDPLDFSNFIANDVSPAELRDRVQLASDVAKSQPEEQKALAAFYGITEGVMTAYFLDPTKSLPIAQQQVEAAKVAAAGERAGLMLDRGQAERVAGLTSSVEQAQQGLSQIAGLGELTMTLPGELASTTPNLNDAIAATFAGNADAQTRLSRRQRARQAAFQQTGTYAATSKGIVGLGQAR